VIAQARYLPCVTMGLMANIIWIIVAVLVGLWILGGILTLLGFLVHVALILLKYALFVAIILAIFNLIAARLRR
jgi:hypothetical protein